MAKGGMNDTVVWISKLITTPPAAELEYLRFFSNSLNEDNDEATRETHCRFKFRDLLSAEVQCR